MPVSELGRPAWVCVDGVEGSGKSTLTRLLAEELGAVVVPEFSGAPFGRALEGAVRESPHHISVSAVAQSLVFIADFIELFESEVAPALAAGRTVISDRGYLSKYSYQYVSLADALGPTAAQAQLDALFRLVPPPRLSLVLDTPMEVIAHRLEVRDGSCDPARMDFIRKADHAARQRLTWQPRLAHVLIRGDDDPQRVLAAASSAVRRLGAP